MLIDDDHSDNFLFFLFLDFGILLKISFGVNKADVVELVAADTAEIVTVFGFSAGFKAGAAENVFGKKLFVAAVSLFTCFKKASFLLFYHIIEQHLQ